MREFRSLKQRNDQKPYTEVQYENQAAITRVQSEISVASSSAPVRQQARQERAHMQDQSVAFQGDYVEYAEVVPPTLRSRATEVTTTHNKAYGLNVLRL